MLKERLLLEKCFEIFMVRLSLYFIREGVYLRGRSLERAFIWEVVYLRGRSLEC